MQQAAFLQQAQTRVEVSLQQAIDQCQTSARLAQAMAYSSLGGGKRIRAALVFAAAHACHAKTPKTVSYTHLTLPTICSV